MSRPSTFSRRTLTSSGTLSRCGLTARALRNASGAAFSSPDFVHDHAEPRQRAEMAGFAGKHLLNVLERMGVIVLEIVERRAPVPPLGTIGAQLDHRIA